MMRCELFCHSELSASVSPGVSVLMLRVVVCECSAADVWQGLSLSLWARKVCFVKWAQPSVAIKTTISCQGPSLLWENSCVRQQGSHQMGSARSEAASTCILFLSVQEKKGSIDKQKSTANWNKNVFINSTDVSVQFYFLYGLVVQFITIILKKNCQRNLCQSKFALPK